MNKKKLIIAVIAVIITLGILAYGYYGLLYKEARDISSEVSAFTVTANDLAKEYSANIKSADSKYLNRTIKLKGIVTEIKDSLVILNDKIVCGFDTVSNRPLINNNITIKGRCIGFDELFSEVKLDQCTIKQ